MPIQNIPTAPGEGIPLCEAYRIINANFQYAIKPERIDISAGNFSASFRDDGAGNLGWYVGAAGAADGSQVKVATVDKTTGAVTLGRSAPQGSVPLTVWGPALSTTLNAESTIARFRVTDANDNGLRIFLRRHNPAEPSWYGSSLRIEQNLDSMKRSYLEFSPPGTPDGIALGHNATEFARFLPNGNVGIGTSAPGDKLTLAGASGDVFMRTTNGSVSMFAGAGNGGVGIIGTTSAHDFQLWARNGARVFVSDTSTIFNGVVVPGVDNFYSCGLASNRWSVIYAGTGTINTSDATMKALRDGTLIGLNFKVSPLEAAEIAAAKEIVKEIGVFKWQDAIEAKGDAARLHIGPTVQRVVQIMEGHGLDPWAYGFMCRDEITRKVKMTETRSVQAVEAVEEPYSEIEVRDGVPVQVLKTRTVDHPLTVLVVVHDENGVPVTSRVQATEDVVEIVREIELQDDQPVLVSREQTVKKPLFTMVAVLDEAGQPVTRIEQVIGESGFPDERAVPVLHPVPIMIDEPVMHAAPVMEDREVEVWVEEPAGDRLGFRADQLSLFLLAALAQ